MSDTRKVVKDVSEGGVEAAKESVENAKQLAKAAVEAIEKTHDSRTGVAIAESTKRVSPTAGEALSHVAGNTKGQESALEAGIQAKQTEAAEARKTAQQDTAPKMGIGKSVQGG